MKFGKTEIAKEKFSIKICDVNLDNIVISKVVKTKINSMYLIVYLDKDIRPLVLIIPRMSGYVKTFNIEDKINKSMSFRINGEKLLEKYKAILTNIEDLKNVNVIQSFLLILYLYMKTNITCKYI